MSLPHFSKWQHRISEWLSKLKQRFVLADVEDDARKIKFVQVSIGQTGEDILTQLLDVISWEDAKRELIDRLGDGTVEDEACTALKQLECGNKDIVDLGAEAAKLARKAYPEQEETANRLAVETFVRVLDPKVALEVQKLGHRELDNVIATARRIELWQEDYPSPNMDSLVTVLQDKLRVVRKELKESAAAAAIKALCVAQPAAMVLKPANPAADRYVAPSAGACTPPCRRRCFLCDQERHFVASCPIRAETFRYLQQNARQATTPPARCALSPAPPAEDIASEDGPVSLN